MSYPKALRNLGVACSVSITAFCRNHQGPDRDCWVSDCVHREFDATKLDGYRAARQQGWTYDADGEWLCPHCTQQPKEEA